MADIEVDHQLLSGARRILAAKLALIEALPPGYANDPAVVILLQLFLRHLEHPMTQRDLCDSVPHISASLSTRWVALLANDGLIARYNSSEAEDPLVSLTTLGVATISATILSMGDAEKRMRDEYASTAASDVKKWNRA
jgi:hypothetical protein